MKKLILLSMVILTGCSGWPANVAELKDQGMTTSFTVDQAYQQVYRNLKTMFDRCSQEPGLWQLGSTVDAQLYPDLEEGQFIIKLVPQTGQPKPIILIDIYRISKDQSDVVVVHLPSLDKKSIPVYQRWANGDITCE